jgi:hypothetical protein
MDTLVIGPFLLRKAENLDLSDRRRNLAAV